MALLVRTTGRSLSRTLLPSWKETRRCLSVRTKAIQPWTRELNPTSRLISGTRLLSLSSPSSQLLKSAVVQPQQTTDVELLKNLPQYRDYFYHYDEARVAAEVESEAGKRFIELTRAAPAFPLWAEEYKEFLDPLLASLSQISEAELQHVLFHLQFFPSPKDLAERKKYAGIWGRFDEECIQRGVKRRKWRAPITFVYADLFSTLRLGRLSTYNWICLKLGLKKIDSSSRERAVRLCQIIVKARTIPKDLKLYNLEYNLIRIMNDSQASGCAITPLELAFLCAVFYKMRMPLHHENIAKAALEVCISNAKTITNSSLAGISAGLAVSRRLPIGDSVDELFKVLVPEVPRLEAKTLASLLLLATRTRVKNVLFLEAAEERLEVLTRQGVLMEPHLVQWVAEAFLDLSYPNTSGLYLVHDMVMKTGSLEAASDEANPESESEDEETEVDRVNCNPDLQQHRDKETDAKCDDLTNLIAKRYGKRLPLVLACLADGGIFPASLIAKGLSSEFLRKHYGKGMHAYNQDILRLDVNVAGECSQYTGPRLTEKELGFLMKKTMTWIPEEDKVKVAGYEFTCRDIRNALIKIFGDPCFVHMCNVLPQYDSIENVFCTNAEGEVVPVPECFKEKLPFFPKNLTEKDIAGGLQYHLVLHHYWDKVIKTSDEAIGSHKKIAEKAAKMGYRTYETFHFSWRQTPPDKSIDFLRKIIGANNYRIPDIARSTS